MKNQEWQIRSRSDQCARCSRPFEHDEELTSTLFFGEEGYQREDYCTECHKQIADSKSWVSVWRGIYKKPPPPAPEALRRETAESLLRSLIEEEDPANINTIFILAVMLERRRILAEKEVYKNEQKELCRVYEHKKTGEAFLIRDPQLRLAELESVQQEVVARLGAPASQESEPDSSTATA